ncbi:MAG: phospho-sugar mutase [Myxococcales bacterium]|nr:phospho-sugar mutase [Myxococcales bacterium]
MSTEANDAVVARAQAWLREDPDEQTRAELQAILERNDLQALEDRFLAKLEFGTAGLRGVLGAGPNRMNRAVVLRTTAGLCKYLLAHSADAQTRGIVVGYDGRKMSREFAEDVASVCAGLGVRAHLFVGVAPTPLVAFAVTALGASAGVMVTASHNPPEYNGYKVYWENGAQIIPPHDIGIAAEIDAIGPLTTVARPILKEARAKGLVVDVAPEIEARYLDAVAALQRNPGVGRDLVIAYTPLHGVGYDRAKAALARFGFESVHVVEAQREPDGAFPTVNFPNPEEKGALDLVYALADRVSADLVLANDPDADRLAAAEKHNGAWRQLTGNEVGALFAHYLLVDASDTEPSKRSTLTAITTIVSSPLLGELCRSLGVRYDEVLTGFKWIANRALDLAASTGERFVFGYEEALGYTVGEVVRDKDGVGSAAVFAELTAFYRSKHKRSLFAQLDEVYRRTGVFVSGQHNVTIKGLEGASKIRAIMDGFRKEHPKVIGPLEVESVTDIQMGHKTLRDGTTVKLALPPSNVIAYALQGGSRVTLRPSGTEPKIKYYFDVREPVRDNEPVSAARERASAQLEALKAAFVALADAVAP